MELRGYQSTFTQVKDKSIQIDDQLHIGNCANVTITVCMMVTGIFRTELRTSNNLVLEPESFR